MSTAPTHLPLPPHLPEPTSQPEAPSNATTHYSKLNILPPEILHKIFTYLSHVTLRQSVNRVCKQWRLISNHYIHRNATWMPVDPKIKNKKSKKNKNKNKGSEDVKAGAGAEAEFHEMLLNQLEGGKVDTFECWNLNKAGQFHKVPKYFWGYPELWDDFITAMHARLAIQTRSSEESEDNVEGGDGGGRCRLFESIRTLNIYGDMVDPEKMVVDLKPCFEFLETLKIEILITSRKALNIFTILDNGPRLKSVEIVAIWDYFMEIIQGDTTPTTTTTTTTTAAIARAVPDNVITGNEPMNRQPHSTYYPLQQLILQGIWIDTLMTAERIIKTCPDLRVLKSIQIETSTCRGDRKQWEPSVMQEASKCLAELARIHCPHLVWYQSDLQYIYQLPNETRLIELAQRFPEMRALSMMAYEDPGPISTPLHPPYQPVLQTPFLPDLINTFLNRITVLEVSSKQCNFANWRVLNRIICLCPHLQDLLISNLLITMTEQLDQTSCQPLESLAYPVLLNESLWVYDESDKETRQRDRRERQNFRDMILPVDFNDQDNYPRLDPYLPVPRIWPCRHTLRKLDISLIHNHGMKHWTRHIRAYRLFGHLTSFKVRCQELKIGQIKDCHSGDSKKPKDEPLSSSSRKGRSTDEEYKCRYRNELLALRGLVYLEEFVVEAIRLRGTVVPEDFEFLRRKEPDFGTRFFPPPPLLPQQATGTRTSKRTEGDDGEGSDSEYDSEDENDYGRVEAYRNVETFWPRLTTFHASYMVTPPVNDPKVLVPAIEQIRPGVSFRLRSSPIQSLNG